MARVLIAGCGYVGASLGELLAEDGHEVFGLRRNPRTLPAAITPIEADLTDINAVKRVPSELDIIFYLVSPSGGEDAQYKHAYLDGLQRLAEGFELTGQTPRRLIFASSTSVYAQDDGGWIDEASAAEPQHFRGRRLLEAEALVRSLWFPSVVVRFGGIYGPRRTRLIDRVRAGQATYRTDPGRYTNRIHREDCAGALRHLMTLEKPEPLYLGVDSDPADERVVLDWLAGVLGSPEPRPAQAGTERREVGSKRCSNERLVGSGYSFRYPSFREGYVDVIQQVV
jgi:nucleoside-diphosphate-sugar epimerase